MGSSSNTPTLTHLEPGQLVADYRGAWCRVVSKAAGPSGISVKLASLHGGPAPDGFIHAGTPMARFAAMMRFHIAYNRDFDLYINEYCKRFFGENPDGSPKLVPLGRNGKPFRWADWFEKKVAPRLHVPGKRPFDQVEEIRDEIIHEMIFEQLNPYGRNLLGQFEAKIKNFPEDIRKLDLGNQLNVWLTMSFNFLVDKMNRDIQRKYPPEEISMWQGTGDEGEEEFSVLDTEEHAVNPGEFQMAEAKRDVATLREGFGKWLNKKMTAKAAQWFIALFDIYWNWVRLEGGGNQEEEEKSDERPAYMPARRELEPAWQEKTHLNPASLYAYIGRLSSLLREYIKEHRQELGNTNIFVKLIDDLDEERDRLKPKPKGKAKLRATPIHASLASLNLASTGAECIFIEWQPDQWYYILENRGYEEGDENRWDWREDASAYGPFGTQEKAIDHLRRSHPNPGGWSSEPYSEGREKDGTLEKLIADAPKNLKFGSKPKYEEISVPWPDYWDTANGHSRASALRSDAAAKAGINLSFWDAWQYADTPFAKLPGDIQEKLRGMEPAKAHRLVPRKPKSGSFEKEARLVRGDGLTPEMRQQVLDAFPYRWTADNSKRLQFYKPCPSCDIKQPFVGGSAEGHNHPTIPLISDDEWLAQHAFHFTNDGRLFPNRHAEPAGLAPAPEGKLFASADKTAGSGNSAYMYQAALLCGNCGGKVKAGLDTAGKAPANPQDESSFDSDDYPKGPYPDGGGEADAPQHCDMCGKFLENPLTTDGYRYVQERVNRAAASGEESEALHEWLEFYPEAFDVEYTPQEEVDEALKHISGKQAAAAMPAMVPGQQQPAGAGAQRQLLPGELQALKVNYSGMFGGYRVTRSAWNKWDAMDAQGQPVASGSANEVINALKSRTAAAGQLECCGGYHGHHKQGCPVYEDNFQRTMNLLKGLPRKKGEFLENLLPSDLPTEEEMMTEGEKNDRDHLYCPKCKECVTCNLRPCQGGGPHEPGVPLDQKWGMREAAEPLQQLRPDITPGDTGRLPHGRTQGSTDKPNADKPYYSECCGMSPWDSNIHQPWCRVNQHPREDDQETNTSGRESGKQATGEMSSVDPEEWPAWFAIAKRLGGTVVPFDVYQGPYVRVPGFGKFWITSEDGHFGEVYNELTQRTSEFFELENDESAIDAALSTVEPQNRNKLMRQVNKLIEEEEKAEQQPGLFKESAVEPDWKQTATTLLQRAAGSLQDYCTELNGDMNDSLAMEIEKFLAAPAQACPGCGSSPEQREGMLQPCCDKMPRAKKGAELGHDWQADMKAALAALGRLTESGPTEDIREGAKMTVADLQQFEQEANGNKQGAGPVTPQQMMTQNIQKSQGVNPEMQQPQQQPEKPNQPAVAVTPNSGAGEDQPMKRTVPPELPNQAYHMTGAEENKTLTGTVDKIQLSQPGGLGYQWTTIDGETYGTLFDYTDPNMAGLGPGAVVEYEIGRKIEHYADAIYAKITKVVTPQPGYRPKTSALRSGQNIPAVENEVGRLAGTDSQILGHEKANPVFEHEQWWIVCNACGAIWAVEDTSNGLAVEAIDSGDGTCYEMAQTASKKPRKSVENGVLADKKKFDRLLRERNRTAPRSGAGA